MPALTPDIEAAARQIGIDAAQAYLGQDPFDVARALGLSVDWVDDDHIVAGLRLRAEYDHHTRRIILYRRGIAELAGDCEQIAVAHELFHHLAATEPTINEALRALPRNRRTTIEEIAAHAFAKRMALYSEMSGLKPPV